MLYHQLAKAKYYWWLLLLITLVAIVGLYIYGRDNYFLLLTSHRTPLLDRFFTIITHIGDGLFSLAVALFFLLWKKRKMALQIILSFLYAGLLAQLIKRIVNRPRPAEYFIHLQQKSIAVTDATVWGGHSFPSGHTTTAFALLAILLYYYPKSSWLFFPISIASMVAYSRIYVVAHFPEDVIVGAWLGLSSIFIIHFLEKKWLYKYV